ncbi:hypothetical protein QBC39DRAFT_40319 [Podospora conica]|nr:hypothetical protein QBC39DRAFT_40319 [Schizothecium conicum]
MPQGSGCDMEGTERKGGMVGASGVGFSVFFLFFLLRLFGCCAQVGRPMHSDTLHSFGLFFVYKTGTGGAMWTGFLGGLVRGRAGDLVGRACFLGRGLPSIMDPTTRGNSQHFPFCHDIWGGDDQHQDKALRTLAHRLHHTQTHTHDFNDTTIFYVHNTTAVESATPTLFTKTHSQGRRSRHQEGPTTARRAVK